jgi:hypothetical protein
MQRAAHECSTCNNNKITTCYDVLSRREERSAQSDCYRIIRVNPPFLMPVAPYAVSLLVRVAPYAVTAPDYRLAPWHFLNFFPDPHGHGSFRPTFVKSLPAPPIALPAIALDSDELFPPT